MKDKTKKATAIIVVIFFLLAFVLPFIFTMFVQAAPNEHEKNKQKIQQEINAEKQLQKNVLEEKKKADEKVTAIEKTLDEIQAELNVHNARLAELEVELQQADKAVDTQYETLKKRIRVMYEQGTDNYLEVLLNSGSITDFLNRFEIIKQIAEYDNNRLDNLRAEMDKLAQATQQLEAVKKSKEEKKTAFNREKAKLEQEQAKRDAILDESKLNVEELEKRYQKEDELDKKAKAAAAANMSKNSTFVGGIWQWPAPASHNITSPFGSRFHPVLKKQRMHYGIDIGAPKGSSVVAANDGTVITAQYSSSYGNYVIIDHGGGVASLYAHGSGICVSVGQKVTRGQQLMKVDSTGISTGPHLHFEVIVNGNNVNPTSYVGG